MISDLPDSRRSLWGTTRIARLGFLIGCGWDAKRIAADPLVASTPNNVYRQAQRVGLAFRDAGPLLLTPTAEAHCAAAARKRGVSRETLLRLLICTAAEDPGLIDNILDDGA